MAFAIAASVKSVVTDWVAQTYFEIYMEDGSGNIYPGDASTDVTDITIIGPSGQLSHVKNDFVYNSGSFKQFFLNSEGHPEAGEYTFQVTVDGVTEETTDIQTTISEITLPSISTLLPADGSVVQEGDVDFAWGLSGTGNFYRLDVRDISNNIIYTGTKAQDGSSETVSLLAGNYKWRVRISDAMNWKDVNNRSQHYWQYLIVE